MIEAIIGAVLIAIGARLYWLMDRKIRLQIKWLEQRVEDDDDVIEHN